MTITRTFIAALAALTVSGSVCADDNLDQLAERLISLRSEVEELNQELDLLKQEHRQQMQSLAAQRAELEATENRAQTSIKQLEQKLEENRAAASAAGIDNAELKPLLMDAINQLGGYIESGIPFKTDERLAELNELRLQLETEAIPANRAANRLWAFFEDEIRLTRENGIYSQTITLDGKRLLADVAKLGSVMMYFRTDDERYGKVIKSTNGWQFVAVEEPAAIASVQYLFDSLQKQIRQGFFTVPNTLSGRGASS